MRVGRCLNCINVGAIATYVARGDRRIPVCENCAPKAIQPEVSAEEEKKPLQKRTKKRLPLQPSHKVVAALGMIESHSDRVLAALTHYQPCRLPVIFAATQLPEAEVRKRIYDLRKQFTVDGQTFSYVVAVGTRTYALTEKGLERIWRKHPEACGGQKPILSQELERFAIAVPESEYKPLSADLLTKLAEGWDEWRYGEPQKIRSAFKQVAKLAGIKAKEDARWNQTIDWLDAHHPTWRGCSVAINRRHSA